VVEEGFGLVPLEGAFAHVPIVAARIGALPGVLRDEQEALYFPPRDAIGAADALAQTLRERAETTARVERAAARAETFSLDRMHAAHAEFVQEAVSALREWRG
jgi:glycosyltransferase involved in cell wall biosynthesis